MQLHIADATNELRSLQPIFGAALDQVLPVVKSDLELSNIDILIINDKHNLDSLIIPEMGVSGFAFNKKLVLVHVDPEHEKVSVDNLAATLYHELHHIKRYEGPGYGTTLIDDCIFEGLAVCYEKEKLPDSFLARRIRDHKHPEQIIEQIKPRFEEESPGREDWFIFGDDELPRWAGYIAGYHICKQYLADHDKTATELALEPADTFWQHWQATSG